MTEPLTPPDCDLRGLQFMPLDVVRLLDSDLFALSNGEEFKAAVALWCKSWNQVPAASLPCDDRILARFAGLSHREWAAVKAVALTNWVLCDDNRIYHPTVAEKALEAWEDRQHRQETIAGERERKRRERLDRQRMFAALRERNIVPGFNTSTSQLRALLRREGLPEDIEPVTRTNDTQADCHADKLEEVTTKDGTGRNRTIDEPNGSSPAQRARGRRIPDDWKATEEDRAFAAKEGLTPEETDRAAAEFCDFWRSESGARACKRDWSLAFRNRLRQVSDRKRERGARLAAQANGSGANGRGFASIAQIAVERGAFD